MIKFVCDFGRGEKDINMTSTGRAFLTLFGLSLIVSYLLMLNELKIMLNWGVENYVTFKQRHINHIPLVIIGLWTIVRWITIHIIYDFLIPKALFINLIMRWSELAPGDTIVMILSRSVSLWGKTRGWWVLSPNSKFLHIFTHLCHRVAWLVMRQLLFRRFHISFSFVGNYCWHHEMSRWKQLLSSTCSRPPTRNMSESARERMKV